MVGENKTHFWKAYTNTTNVNVPLNQKYEYRKIQMRIIKETNKYGAYTQTVVPQIVYLKSIINKQWMKCRKIYKKLWMVETKLHKQIKEHQQETECSKNHNPIIQMMLYPLSTHNQLGPIPFLQLM
jgi:uncharacterized membrane protein YgaE (UPF0421/DUF939 family)